MQYSINSVDTASANSTCDVTDYLLISMEIAGLAGHHPISDQKLFSQITEKNILHVVTLRIKVSRKEKYLDIGNEIDIYSQGG